MPLAYETRSGVITDSTTIAAVTAATGDTFNVRNFGSADYARLESIIRDGATKGVARVRSPLLHDNVTGIVVASGTATASYMLPAGYGQMLRPSDILTVESQSGSADSTVVGTSIFYSNLPGASARLYSPGDIIGNIKNIKGMPVAVTNSATIGDWTDTLITASENQLHSDSDYAVLGWDTTDELSLVAVLGQATGNLRCGGPGTDTSLDTSDYFVYLTERYGTPHIPVFNGNDRNATYVSTADNTASSTATVTLVLAELITPLT